MNGVYDLSRPDERLRLALSAPTKATRAMLIGVIRRQHGEAAAEAIKAELREMAAA